MQPTAISELDFHDRELDFHDREFDFHDREFDLHGRELDFHNREFDFHDREFDFHGREFDFHGREFDFHGREFDFHDREFDSHDRENDFHDRENDFHVRGNEFHCPRKRIHVRENEFHDRGNRFHDRGFGVSRGEVLKNERDGPAPGKNGAAGSSAQILAQIARADGREVYAVTTQPDFGTVVCAGIHMSDIPSFPYAALWGERVLRSVANLTRDDGLALFYRLKTLRIETQRTVYPLENANVALAALRSGELTGTAILRVS